MLVYSLAVLDAVQKLDRPRKKSICPVPLREETGSETCALTSIHPERGEAKPEMKQSPAFLFP